MRLNQKTIPLTSLSLCLIVFGWQLFDALGAELFQRPFSGTLLIHIGNKKCHDFTYSFPDNTLRKTHEGSVYTEKKDEVEYVVCRGSTYRETWKQTKGTQFLDEIQIQSLFGEYNLPGLSRFVLEKYRKECDPHKSFQLIKKPYSEVPKATYLYPHYFHINEQRSHAIYRLGGLGPGVLINLTEMKVSVPFCNDDLDHVLWDKTGRYVGYITPMRIFARGQKQRLKVKDITTLTTVLDSPIDRWGADIAWSPNSKYIAVLSYLQRFGFWPWELLQAVAGHPVPHNSFYLSVYDMKSTQLLTQEIIGNIVYGTGSILWVD